MSNRLVASLLLIALGPRPGWTHWVDQVVAATEYIGPILPVAGK